MNRKIKRKKMREKGNVNKEKKKKKKGKKVYGILVVKSSLKSTSSLQCSLLVCQWRKEQY
jgi:hypothetical protein